MYCEKYRLACKVANTLILFVWSGSQHFHKTAYVCAQWNTVNPFYTDTRYNDKIRYNDNLNVTKPSLKRWRLMRNYAKTKIKSSSNICFGYLLESPQRGDSNNYPKHMFCEEIRIYITKTYLYNFDPLRPHFNIVNWGLQGCTLFFLFLLKNIDCGYSLEAPRPPRRGGSNQYSQSMFWAEIWKISEFFLSENCQFLDVKFSIYLNRHVFVMIRPFLHIILSIKDSLQQQIHYNGNIFGNKCCRCNEGSLYRSANASAQSVQRLWRAFCRLPRIQRLISLRTYVRLFETCASAYV